jgi:hypothetical protein
MAKMVGLSRKIKLQWLNKAVEFLDDNLSEEEFKTKLNEYLAFEIDSATVLRKTREILMHTWVYDEDESVAAIRREALNLFKKYPDYATSLHWSMLLLVYPVFADICKLIGRISEFQDEITLTQLKQKMYDEWGERTTLYHSTDKIIATIKELGVISCEKPGKYIINKRAVNKESLVNFLLLVAMKVDGNSYYTFTDIKSFDVLFPFEYQIGKEQLMLDQHFTITNFGGETTVSIRS